MEARRSHSDEDYLDFDFGGFDLGDFESCINADDMVKAQLKPDPKVNWQQAPTEISSAGSKKSAVKGKRVYPKKNYPVKRGMSVGEALVAGGAMPNMSRRPPTNVMVAFPVFDRCDSLVYFPHTFARHLNSGDSKGLTKLLSTHMHKECQINAIFGSRDKLCIKGLVTYTDMANEVEPDRIMCVHSTKVVENQIRSTIYMKQTDSQPLYNLMSNTLRSSGTDFSSIIRRSDRFNLYDKDTTLNSEAIQQLMYHASLEEDLVLYLRCECVLTFDDVTKKVLAMEVVGRLTSAEIATLSAGNRSHSDGYL